MPASPGGCRAFGFARSVRHVVLCCALMLLVMPRALFAENDLTQLATPETEAAPVLPPDIERLIASAIAEAWRVPPESVEVHPSETARGRNIEVPACVRLAGLGLDGWFTAVLEDGTRVPPVLRVRAGVRGEVPVAARPLTAGTTLAAGDLRTEARLAWGPPSTSAEDSPREGWTVRRSVREGEVLAWPAVAPPSAIGSGDLVSFEWRQGGVAITVPGIALHAAREGERVRARVQGRRDRVVGIVLGPGMARLEMGVTR